MLILKNRMFKFRSYNVKKETEKNEKKQPSSASKTPSYSALTLRKPPKKEKKKASTNEIREVGNKQSPEYRRSTSASLGSGQGATAKNWQTNKTYSPKPKPKKEEAKPKKEEQKQHKKLEKTLNIRQLAK